MQELDWSVGKIMFALKESGIADNTIVIFTSDNGPTAKRYAKPEVVKELMELGDSIRRNLGEYMRRGRPQRPTGSLFPDVPVVSHQKDWGTLSPATVAAIEQERQKRHPSSVESRSQ